jgi:quercetin dioxygenase-like cupin family protein
MHKTATIDFVFIINGQIELILDEGSYLLKQGDSIVQRSTRHSWQVVGKDPCTIALVLVSSTIKE